MPKICLLSLTEGAQSDIIIKNEREVFGMPGPGGGSRGGGGRGGSFGGGGFGGGPRPGGFGGGPRPGGFGGHHHHHHHHHGPYFGWGFGPRRYYGGGGGCLGPVIVPIFVAVFIIFALIFMMLPADNTSDFGKEYDEAAFQEAADRKYAEYFAPGATYEDNILLYFLVEEDCEQIYFIAWVGDNIHYDINYLFGGNSSALGNSIYNNVAQYYAYSLDSNLAAVVNDMESAIESLGLESSFKKETRPASPSESKFVDLTGAGEPTLTAETINDALASFTESTGIRTVVAVDYIDNVFGSSGGGGTTALLVIAIGILVAAIAFTSYSSNKNRKKQEK